MVDRRSARQTGSAQQEQKPRIAGWKVKPSRRGLPMFVRNDLDELVGCDKRPAVSVCMPTHPAVMVVDQLRPTGPAAAILRY
jgi:hypothetical protein